MGEKQTRVNETVSADSLNAPFFSLQHIPENPCSALK